MTEQTPESGQIALLTSCALPGCTSPVVDPGDVCGGCREAFGDMLGRSTAPVRPAEVVAAVLEQRDRDVAEAYREQARIATEPTVKANQVCWLCTERRKCTEVDGRWECPDCIDVTGAVSRPGLSSSDGAS